MTLSTLIEKYGRPILESKREGFTRAMFYNAENSDVRIYVRDRAGVIFVLNPPVFLAIDAWRNPYFYADAAMQGIDNPKRLVPAEIAA